MGEEFSKDLLMKLLQVESRTFPSVFAGQTPLGQVFGTGLPTVR